MKIGIDELRDSVGGEDHGDRAGDGGQAPNPEPEPEPDPGTSPPAGMDFTIGEFLEFKSKERRLQEELRAAEEEQTSLADSLKSFMADPEARQMLTELWHGKDETPQQPARQPDRPRLGDGGRARGPSEAGGSTDMTQHDGDGYVLDEDRAYEMLVDVIQNVAQMQPDLTAEQMATNAERFEGQIKQQLSSKLAEFEDRDE